MQELQRAEYPKSAPAAHASSRGWAARITIVHAVDELRDIHFNQLAGDGRFLLLSSPPEPFQDLFATCLRSAPCILVSNRKWLQGLAPDQKAELLRHDASIRVIACVDKGATPGAEDFAATGCWALVPACTGVSELVQIFDTVARGGMWATPEVLSRVVRHLLSWGNAKKLSRREGQIMKLMADSKTNKIIAEELFLSEETVRWHLRNMYSKTGVVGRQGMIRYAREQAAIS